MDEFSVGDTVEAQWKGRQNGEGTAESVGELTLGTRCTVEGPCPSGCRSGAEQREEQGVQRKDEADIREKLNGLTRRRGRFCGCSPRRRCRACVKQRLEKYTGQSRDWYPRQFIDETPIGRSQGRADRCMEDDVGGCLLYREKDPTRTPPHGPHAHERARKRPKVAAPSRRDQRSNPSAEAIACSARQIHTIANELIGGHDGDELWLAKCLRDPRSMWPRSAGACVF